MPEYKPLIEIDYWLFFKINHDLANPLFDTVLVLFREAFFWVPLYVFILSYLVLNFKTQGFKIALAILFTFALSDQLSASIIKPFFERLRPCNQLDIAHYVRLLVKCGSGYSFVSSHATNHFAIAAFMVSLSKVMPVLFLRFMYIWAFSVALAQVYVGVHFPIDVICGGLLGILVGKTTFVVLRKYMGL